MGRKSKKKGKAASQAPHRERGRPSTPKQKVDDPALSAFMKLAESGFANAQPGFWDKRLGRTRLTYRAAGLFLLGCTLLDVVLFLIFKFGLGQCYGVLCLI